MARRMKAKTTLRGKDAGTGKFIKVSTARRRKRTAIVERIPVPKRKHKS
jgi:hypothetical protein